jgi:hypothetical protein
MAGTGDYRQIFTMFQDKGADTEALRAVLSENPVFADINKLLGMDPDQLSRLGQQGLMKAFGTFTSSDQSDIQSIMASSKGDSTKLRDRLLEKLARSETVQAAAKEGGEQKMEVLLNQTANILNKLCADLKVTDVKKSAA